MKKCYIKKIILLYWLLSINSFSFAYTIIIEPKYDQIILTKENIDNQRIWVGIDTNNPQDDYDVNIVTKDKNGKETKEKITTHQKNIIYGLMDFSEKWIVKPKYKAVGNFSDDLAGVSLDKETMSYIDKEGKDIIPIAYQYCSYCSFINGITPVYVAGNWGLIDKAGRFTASPKYFDIQLYSNNLAIASEQSLPFSPKIIDINGQNILESSDKFKIDTLRNLFSDLSKIIVKSDDQFFFVDIKGNDIFQKKFEDAWQYNEGLARVKINGKWGYIDEAGDQKIAPIYDQIGTFKNGFAEVKLNSLWGIIDKSGKTIIPNEFSELGRYDDLTRACIGDWEKSKKDKKMWKCGFIDQFGKYKINPIFDDAHDFKNLDIAWVKINGKWGAINKNSELIIQPQFDTIGYHDEKLAVFSINGKYGILKY